MDSIYNIPKRDPNTFVEDREILVQTISGLGDAFDCNPDFSDELRVLLGNFYSEVEMFRTDHLGGPGVSFCFDERCQIIKSTVFGVNVLMKAACCAGWEIVNVLKWIGIAVGRLRLAPMFGADEAADSREEEAAEEERLWNPMAGSSIKLWPSSSLLSDIWLTIHFAVPTCICSQCISFQETPTQA